jgi:hypothetical protein
MKTSSSGASTTSVIHGVIPADDIEQPVDITGGGQGRFGDDAVRSAEDEPLGIGFLVVDGGHLGVVDDYDVKHCGFDRFDRWEPHGFARPPEEVTNVLDGEELSSSEDADVVTDPPHLAEHVRGHERRRASVDLVAEERVELPLHQRVQPGGGLVHHH